MVKKVLFILLLMSLFLISVVLASATDITVTTLASHKLLITAEKAGIMPPERIESFAPYKDTGANGVVKVSLTTDESLVNLRLDLITNDGTEVLNQLFENVSTNEPVFIDFFLGKVNLTSGNPVIIKINTTENNPSPNSTNETNQTQPAVSASLAQVNQTNLTVKSNFSLSGYLSKIYQNNSKTIFYILIVIGVVVLVLIIIFIVRKIPKKTSHYPLHINHRPLEPLQSHSSHGLIEAEKKLKEAQQEIETIKRKNEEIRNAERKLQEDAMRLEKLRRGY